MSFSLKLNKDDFSYFPQCFCASSFCISEASNKSCFGSCEFTVLGDGKSNAVKYRSFVSVLIKQEVRGPVCQMENNKMGGKKKGM